MKKEKNIKDNNKIILEVERRNIFGRKLKKLRSQGLIPANIYGSNFKSQAVTVNLRDFVKVYKKVKETGIVYLKLNKEEIPVLIKNTQKHPVNNHIIHIDFRKIDLTKKIQTETPIKLVGVSPAVEKGEGVLLTQLNSILIEALPEDIPSSIEVDISSLSQIDQEIKVKDLLKKTTSYEIKTPPEKTIVSVIAHKEETTTAETAPAAPPEVITQAKPEETTAEKKSQSSQETKNVNSSQTPTKS